MSKNSGTKAGSRTQINALSGRRFNLLNYLGMLRGTPRMKGVCLMYDCKWSGWRDLNPYSLRKGILVEYRRFALQALKATRKSPVSAYSTTSRCRPKDLRAYGRCSRID